jgi:hypothetical protein
MKSGSDAYVAFMGMRVNTKATGWSGKRDQFSFQTRVFSRTATILLLIEGQMEKRTGKV